MYPILLCISNWITIYLCQYCLQSRHKQKISGKEVEIATARKDINKLEKQITDANEAKTRLDVLEQRLNTAEE